MAMPPFHLAFPVLDLDSTRSFYGGLLGCPEGRSSPHWIDFDLFGHQIVAHLAPAECGHRTFRQRGRWRSRAGAPFRRHPVDGRLGQAGSQAPGGGHPVPDRAAASFQGPGRRAGDDVLSRTRRAMRSNSRPSRIWRTFSRTRSAIGGQRRGFFFAFGGDSRHPLHHVIFQFAGVVLADDAAAAGDAGDMHSLRIA